MQSKIMINSEILTNFSKEQVGFLKQQRDILGRILPLFWFKLMLVDEFLDFKRFKSKL
jgi:hypothetical protein